MAPKKIVKGKANDSFSVFIEDYAAWSDMFELKLKCRSVIAPCSVNRTTRININPWIIIIIDYNRVIIIW